MRTVHDRSCQAPDWELWVRKGFAKESVHSLRFSYQFTEEDRKLEAQLLEGKEDAERERIQRNIVNERDSFMHHLMSNIASNFICINFEYDRDDNTLFASVMWELYFWCNQFQDMPGRRDYSYFTLTFNREHPAEWKMALCKRVVAYVEMICQNCPNLELTIQYETWFDAENIHKEILRIGDQVVNRRCSYHGMEGKLTWNGEYMLFKKRYAKMKAYRVSDVHVLQIYWQLYPSQREELDLASCNSPTQFAEQNNKKGDAVRV